jgi:hypothetical protein
MNRLIHLTWFAALAALALFVPPAAASAGSGGRYELSWSTLDGGGATRASGGRYELGGTIGQPDAGRLAGGRYELAGGFWSARLVEVPALSAWAWALGVWLPLAAGLAPLSPLGRKTTGRGDEHERA